MGFFKDHWKALLMGIIAVFNGIVGIISLIGYNLSYYLVIGANFCLSIFYPIIEMIDKISEKNESVTAKITPQTKEEISIIKQDVEIVKKEILGDKSKVEKKKEENRLLIDLINENIISVNTLDRNILDKKFISVICYQAGFGKRSNFVSKEVISKAEQIRELNKKLKEKGKPLKEEIDLNREYEKMFEDIGFIRLAGHNTFFIIPEDNIYPEKLRDLNKISDYLIKQGKIIVTEEWEKLKIEHIKHDYNFYETKMKDKDNPVNLNLLIMKINRRDMRQRYILRDDFNKKFSSELSIIVRLNKFKTPYEEKIKISNIIEHSSLKILILSIPEKERQKIVELEENFKKPINEGGLGIINFYDYHKHSLESIKNILKQKFNEEKAKTYAEKIFNNSRDYKKDLEELGINFP